MIATWEGLKARKSDEGGLFIGWLEGSEEGTRACFYRSMVVGAMLFVAKRRNSPSQP